jgi:hypothetical protein
MCLTRRLSRLDVPLAGRRLLEMLNSQARQFVLELYTAAGVEDGPREELRRKLYILLAFVRYGIALSVTARYAHQMTWCRIEEPVHQ